MEFDAPVSKWTPRHLNGLQWPWPSEYDYVISRG